MEKQFPFTAARLAKLTCLPGENRTLYRDTVRPELFLQVTANGTKTFYCRAWHRGKRFTANKPIGKFGLLGIAEARRFAREMAVHLGQGRDPDEERKAAMRRDMTFAVAFESFLLRPLARKKKQERSQKTVAGYQQIYSCYLASTIGRKKLSDLRTEQIDALHTRIGERNGKYVANRAKSLISAVYNDAIRKGWEGVNPAIAVPTYPERRRKRYLKEYEIGPFLRACLEERRYGDATIADAVLVALFTGLRRTNVCAARWRLVSLDRGTWEIPYSDFKNDEEHTVYLNGVVCHILRQRDDARGSSEWIFPGHGRTGHLVEPKKGIARIVQRAGISSAGVSMHCLRHTFLTYADDAGLPSAVRKRLAGHTAGSGDVTAGYTHALESRAREAYEKVARHMLSFVDPRGTVSHLPSLIDEKH